MSWKHIRNCQLEYGQDQNYNSYNSSKLPGKISWPIQGSAIPIGCLANREILTWALAHQVWISLVASFAIHNSILKTICISQS